MRFLGNLRMNKTKFVTDVWIEVNNIKLNVKSIDIIEIYITRENDPDSAYGAFIFFTNYEGITELLTL